MNVFISGGTGFIGSHLINKINSKNNNIYCLRREKSKPRIALKNEIYWTSTIDSSELSKFFKSCEIFIHCATIGVSPQKLSWEDAVRFNVYDSFKILHKAANSGIRKFIIIGSNLESDGPKYDISKNKINTPYVTSKEALFHLFTSFAIENDIEVTYIKLPNVFDRGQYKGNLWPSLRRAAADGEDFIIYNKDVLKEFISIKDAIEIISKILGSKKDQQKKINVINVPGEKKSIYEFSSYHWKKWNASGRLLFK